MQKGLQLISLYLWNDKVSIHPSISTVIKLNVFLLTTYTLSKVFYEFSLITDSSSVSPSPQAKSLAVTPDCSLSFQSHINNIPHHHPHFSIHETLPISTLPSPNTSLLSSSTALSLPVLIIATLFSLASLTNPSISSNWSRIPLLISLPELPHSTTSPPSF